MSMIDVLLILTMVSVVVTVLFSFTILKGIGFKNMFRIFKVKMKKRKGWGFVRLIHQTGIPENIPYFFDGREFLNPQGKEKGKYIYKPHCLVPNEYDIPTISYRAGDSEPIDPRTGLQTVTSARMLEEVMARAIKAEQLMASGLSDWLKENWMKVAIGLLLLIGGFLFLYMHMTDAIVEAGRSASQTIVVNSTKLGK